MKKEIIEGDSKIIVDFKKIPSREQKVFFNPKMELNRTLSILLLKANAQENLQIALPLAGSGIRAIRFLKELPKQMIKHIHINDYSKDASTLIKENLLLNNFSIDKINTSSENINQNEKISVFNLDANKFLENSFGYDYIDIDPFGSPNFLLTNSIKRISRKGILAVTATDTGALAGSYPKAGMIKYFANTENIPQKHELGLRILARKVILMGMQEEKALIPIFTYHFEHYYRIFFKVKKGKTAAAKLFNLINKEYLYCNKCGFSNLNIEKNNSCPHCSSKDVKFIGPCFSGNLQDKEFLKKMISLNQKKENKQIDKMLNKLLEESSINQVGFYDTHDICEKSKKSIPKISYLISTLQEKGFMAVQSANVLTGIKTNASFEEFLKL